MAKVHKVTATQTAGELQKTAFSHLPLRSQIQPCLICAWLQRNGLLWYMHEFSGLVWKPACLYNYFFNLIYLTFGATNKFFKFLFIKCLELWFFECCKYTCKNRVDRNKNETPNYPVHKGRMSFWFRRLPSKTGTNTNCQA